MQKIKIFIFFALVANLLFWQAKKTPLKTTKLYQQNSIVPTTVQQHTLPSNNTAIINNDICPIIDNSFVKKCKAINLQDVQDFCPSLEIELRYASTDNFTHKNLYGCTLSQCFLHPNATAKLVKAQTTLKSLHANYSLLLLDCARPFKVQKEMWDVVKNTPQKKYIAPPTSRSMHNYGMAVDVTIVDVISGKELDMGTPYDYFGPQAQPRYEQHFLQKGQLTRQQIDNRHLLKKVMKAGGFRPILLEWWHFETSTKEYARKNCQLLQ